METNLKNIKYWSEIPEKRKSTTKREKVEYKSEPSNEGVVSLLGNFASRDYLRPAMTGIFFDKNNIVATDAYKFFLIPNKGKYEGLYEIGSEKKIDFKYPDYKVILGKNEERKVFLIDVLKLKTYLSTIIKAKINQKIQKVVLSVGINDEKIGFDAKMLLPILNSFEKLGYDNVYVGYESPTRMMLFCPEKECITNPQKSYGKVPLGLCMPIMIDYDADLGSYNLDTNESFEVYYDIATDNIYNADKTIVEDWNTKPKKAEKKAKAMPSQADDKKKQLAQAIKGLELLAKKGNKIAETTLKALKILYKKM